MGHCITWYGVLFFVFRKKSGIALNPYKMI